MDPQSITVSVIALIGCSVTVGRQLKQLIGDKSLTETAINGLLQDVEDFTLVLRAMKESLESSKSDLLRPTVGHIGDHWRSLSTSIIDGEKTLNRLDGVLTKISKSFDVLDEAGNPIRLKGAMDEIVIYRQHIRSYRDTMQLSMQTIIL
jgi:hypothetical protein